jgi:hypothetical protein
MPKNQVKEEVPPSEEALSHIQQTTKRYPNVDAIK